MELILWSCLRCQEGETTPGDMTVLYLFELSLLLRSELLLVRLGSGVCLCVCKSVFLLCRQQPDTLVHLFSLSPAHSAVRKTSSATLLSVTLAAISLPFLFASWCALSPAVGILFLPLKERDLSLLLHRSSSEPQLLLQVNRGLTRTQRIYMHTCKNWPIGLLCYNQEYINKQEIKNSEIAWEHNICILQCKCYLRPISILHRALSCMHLLPIHFQN